ncbi:uncharacterized protein RSE6_13645 [Rhynchosporium secalis]|uniref:Uncharacterized protein n=1 Tax=Rhynchosporium secalis TaxID=38038 RepID=A0A1E1MTD5_RHYSE|nr:uncharacterized protein RSE6_13645 [Rhynchosporium secalis]
MKYEKIVAKKIVTFSKEQVEWRVQFETFTQYWSDVKEIILRHSATNGAENQTPEPLHPRIQGSLVVQRQPSGKESLIIRVVRSFPPEDHRTLQHKSHVADPDFQADLFLSFLGNALMETARIGVSGRLKERSSLWDEETGFAK